MVSRCLVAARKGMSAARRPAGLILTPSLKRKHEDSSEKLLQKGSGHLPGSTPDRMKALRIIASMVQAGGQPRHAWLEGR